MPVPMPDLLGFGKMPRSATGVERLRVRRKSKASAETSH